MKRVQQRLLLLPALALIASPACQAADGNPNALNAYASSDQVSGISQFGDLLPTDWAYQALSNLIQTYGCVAGYPDGTYRGQRTMTRYEAAALLNACLDHISETTDELKKLLKEFEREMAHLRGRVDGLEARVGELEASQFSTTTRLRGVATFVVGSNTFAGDAQPDLFDSLVLLGIGGLPFTSNTVQYANTARALDAATAFAYDLSVYLDTSFTGADLLRARLRAANFGNSPWFGTNNPIGLNALEIAYEELCGDSDCGDVVSVNRLFYQIPIGAGFTATIGGRVRQDEMLAMWPSAYPADTALDVFTYAGAPGAYNKSLGAGGGLWWKSGSGFSLSASYVSLNGHQGSPGLGTSFGESCDDNSGGLATRCSQSTFTGQMAYGEESFGLALAYSYAQRGAGLYGGNGTPLAVAASSFANNASSVGISGYWSPVISPLFPSISAGWGISGYRLEDDGVLFSWIDGARSQSWYVGLQWSDVLAKGHVFGMAVGQPTFITRVDTAIPDEPNLRIPNDGNYAWEWWYKLQLRDSITITPAIYYLSAPLGQLQKNEGGTLSNFGGLVKTTFRF